MAASQFDAQRAVRMDAEQLNDYMQELFNWSKDMKRKERAQPPPPQQATAPVGKQQASGPTAEQSQREQQAAPPTKAQQQQAGGSAARHPAAHTYEHYSRKWDRFDVDAALAEDEAEAGTSTQQASAQPAQQHGSAAAPSSSGRSAPVAIPQARVTVPVGPSKAAAAGGGAAPTSSGAAPSSAEGWKDAGNAAFKRGQYREAADCYTRSLALQPTCLAFANRAMARLKLGQAAEAEADCSQALALDPLYIKAYQRRATARRQLGQLLGAVEDCESALRLEPNNKLAAKDRAACVAALLKEEGLSPPTRSEWLPLVQSSSADGSGGRGGGGSGSGSTVGGADRSAQQAAAGAGQKAAAPAEPPTGDALISVAAVKRLKPEIAAGAATGVAKVEPAVTDEAPPASQQGAAEQPSATGLVAGGSSRGSAADTAMPDAAQPPEAADKQPAVQQRQPAVVPAATPVVPTAASVAAAPPAAFKAPRTGLEFEKAWKGLKGDRQLQAAYLLTLQPSSLPALLRQALSPGLLAAAAAALLRPGMQQAPATAVGLLEGLAQVPRFDLNLLSVPPRQRAELAADWDAAPAELEAQAGGEGAALAARLAAARQRYKM